MTLKFWNNNYLLAERKTNRGYPVGFFRGTHTSFATLFRVVANEDLVNPGDVLAEQQAKFTCLFQGSQGFTILRLFTMGQKIVSCFSNHIMQVTPLFNIIINFYNVISLFVHRNMYMFVFLFWHLACSFKEK